MTLWTKESVTPAFGIATAVRKWKPLMASIACRSSESVSRSVWTVTNILGEYAPSNGCRTRFMQTSSTSPKSRGRSLLSVLFITWISQTLGQTTGLNVEFWSLPDFLFAHWQGKGEPLGQGRLSHLEDVHEQVDSVDLLHGRDVTLGSWGRSWRTGRTWRTWGWMRRDSNGHDQRVRLFQDVSSVCLNAYVQT